MVYKDKEKERENWRRWYRNNIEYERERSKKKNQKIKQQRNQQGVEYRTKIAKTLGLTYTQFTYQLQLLKKVILQRDEFCVYCGGKAEIVHHELERKDYPELTLTENNMVSACQECHKLHHGLIIGVD